MKITIKKSDITKESVDAIVNAANSSLSGGGGVDGAIHKAAGPELIIECQKIISKIKKLNTGEAVITPAYNIKNVKYIIHTVGPIWQGGNFEEDKKLAKCYLNSAKIAAQNGLKSIAFPSISTGAYGYPVEKAAAVAVKTIMNLKENLDEIRMILFSDYDLGIYEREFKKYENK